MFETAEIFHMFEVAQRAQGNANTTIRNRRSILTTFQRSTGKNLLECTTTDLRERLGREGMAINSRVTERTVFRAFYRWALEDRLITHDPSERLAPIRGTKGKPRPLSEKQIAAIITGGAYRRTRIMITLGVLQGLRVSQIARVRGEDFDFDEGLLHTIAKGNKERWLPLHPQIAEIAKDMPARGWWFPNREENGPILATSVTNVIARAIRRAGITDPTLTPHSLRHAYASEMVERGVDIRVIQELMLHEDLSTTQIYAGVSDRLKRAGIETIPAFPAPRHSGRRRATATSENTEAL